MCFAINSICNEFIKSRSTESMKHKVNMVIESYIKHGKMDDALNAIVHGR